MEIERKYLADPGSLTLSDYKHKELSQGYLSVDPVIRIRRSDDSYILTVKSGGLLKREEFEIDLTEEQYLRLSKKADGTFISKTRYLIPYLDHTIELDIFHEALDGLIYAEVEFDSEEEAAAFTPPAWFLREVTDDGSYTNAALSRLTPDEIPEFLSGLK